MQPHRQRCFIVAERLGKFLHEVEALPVQEINEWFVFWDLGKLEKQIKDKSMTDDERSAAIIKGFGLSSK